MLARRWQLGLVLGMILLGLAPSGFAQQPRPLGAPQAQRVSPTTIGCITVVDVLAASGYDVTGADEVTRTLGREPSIASSPDLSHIVMTSFSGSDWGCISNCRGNSSLFKSSDGGQHWDYFVTIPPPPGAQTDSTANCPCDQTIAYGSDGTLYGSFLNQDPSSVYSIFTLYSTDNGGSWHYNPDNPSAPTNLAGLRFVDQPWLSTGPGVAGGTQVCVGYAAYDSTSNRPFGGFGQVRAADSPSTPFMAAPSFPPSYDSPATLSDYYYNTGIAEGMRVAVTSDRTVWGLFQRTLSGASYEATKEIAYLVNIATRDANNQGQTWGVSNSDLPVTGAKIVADTYSKQGYTTATPNAKVGGVNYLGGGIDAIAADPTNPSRVWIVYGGGRSSDGSGNDHLYLVSATHSGTSVSVGDPVTVSPCGVDAYLPAVAVLPNGEIGVLFLTWNGSKFQWILRQVTPAGAIVKTTTLTKPFTSPIAANPNEPEQRIFGDYVKLEAVSNNTFRGAFPAPGTGTHNSSNIDPYFFSAPMAATSTCFTRGDANGNRAVDVNDVFYLIDYLFAAGPPTSLSQGDVNGDGGIDVKDVFYLINDLFACGPVPLDVPSAPPPVQTGADGLTIGTVTTSVRTGTVSVPVFVKDNPGTALGFDQPAGHRISDLSFQVNYAANPCITGSRFDASTGILGAISPDFAFTPAPVGYGAAIPEPKALIPFTQTGGAAGDKIGDLVFTLNACPVSTLALPVVVSGPGAAMLGCDQCTPDGTETVANGGLGVSNGSLVLTDTPPTISGLSLTTGPTAGGTVVTISGSGFRDGVSVLWGNYYVTINNVTPTEIQIRTQSHPYGRVDVTVVNADGSSATLPGAFLYDDPPVASLSVSPRSGLAPLTVTLSGASSSDPNAGAGDAVQIYAFTFGDGTTAPPQSSPTASHTYTGAGAYTATLTVTDSNGVASNAVPGYIGVSTGSTDNASFVSQSVPTTMTHGATYSVTVTMKNTGTSTWTYAGGYRLGSQNPIGTMYFHAAVVTVPTNVAVSPGSSYTFRFTVTAPSVPGTYNFQYRMNDNGVDFGAKTTNVAVAVN